MQFTEQNTEFALTSMYLAEPYNALYRSVEVHSNQTTKLQYTTSVEKGVVNQEWQLNREIGPEMRRHSQLNASPTTYSTLVGFAYLTMMSQCSIEETCTSTSAMLHYLY
jgi:hypothetical protein